MFWNLSAHEVGRASVIFFGLVSVKKKKRENLSRGWRGREGKEGRKGWKGRENGEEIGLGFWMATGECRENEDEGVLVI